MASGTSATEKRRDELREAFKVNNRDGNGFVPAAEIRRTMREKLAAVELCETFEGFDRDGYGLISAADLMQVARSMVREADADGDEQINYEAFCEQPRSWLVKAVSLWACLCRTAVRLKPQRKPGERVNPPSSVREALRGLWL